MAFPRNDGSPNKSWCSSTSDGFLQQLMVFANQWWVSPTSDGFLQQVMVLLASDGSANKWWFSQHVMVFPTRHRFLQEVMVFSNKWLCSQQVIGFSNKLWFSPTSDGSSNKLWFSPQVPVVPISDVPPNKWRFTPTSCGFCQQVMGVSNNWWFFPTSENSPNKWWLNKWWFSQEVMVLPASHGYFQQVIVFFNKWNLLSTSDGFLQQVMFLSNK